MKIIQRDLFNFIFHPENLDRIKLDYLSENKNLFKTDIELLRTIRKNLTDKISDEIIQKIIQKISKLNSKSVVLLEPVKKKNISNSEHIVFAADSPKHEKEITSETFEDKNSKYLIKVISNAISNRIFLFNRANTEMKNIRINLEPSGQTHLIESSNNPLILTPRQDINNILILDIC